jgi:hypothetical protein
VKILCVVLVAVFSGSAISAANLLDSEHPRTPRRVWVRRLTMAAACSASLAFDTFTTRRAVSAGAVETNGLFANSQGQPQWGRMIGIKAAFCGASAVLQETHIFRTRQSPSADWTWTGINAGTAAVYFWAGWHNLQVAKQLRP